MEHWLCQGAACGFDLQATKEYVRIRVCRCVCKKEGVKEGEREGKRARERKSTETERLQGDCLWSLVHYP